MGYKNNEKRRWKRFYCSFVYAWNGIKHVIIHEQNMKIHVLVAVITISLACLIGVSKIEFLLLLLVIGTVFALEIMNTAVEKVVDLVTENYHPIAKIAKDISAGAVLIFSFFAVIIGIIIFYQPIIEFLKGL